MANGDSYSLREVGNTTDQPSVLTFLEMGQKPAPSGGDLNQQTLGQAPHLWAAYQGTSILAAGLLQDRRPRGHLVLRSGVDTLSVQAMSDVVTQLARDASELGIPILQAQTDKCPHLDSALQMAGFQSVDYVYRQKSPPFERVVLTSETLSWHQYSPALETTVADLVYQCSVSSPDGALFYSALRKIEVLNSYGSTLTERTKQWWLAKREDNEVGVLLTQVSADKLSVQFMGVLEAFRRQGYGNELMNMVVHLAEEKGLKLIGLYVEQSNMVATHLYEKYGFKAGDPVRLWLKACCNLASS